jgi:hypothetical protein
VIVLNDKETIDDFGISNPVIDESVCDGLRVVTRDLCPSVAEHLTLSEAVPEPSILDNVPYRQF